MLGKASRSRVFLGSILVLSMVALLVPTGIMATPHYEPGPWWDVEPEPEVPSIHYDSILYSEIAPRLREIETSSDRIKVEVTGQSAGGRNLFLVTISAPEAINRLEQYQAISRTMLNDPEAALAMIDENDEFVVPVLLNGSAHGDEYPGVDAAMRLIERLAYDESEEVQTILANVILLVNVVQNPDGRVLGTPENAAGFDLNRDFITQTQPETRATVRLLTEWNPLVMLDLQGFKDPMWIDEPAAAPHNPNYEYDLYSRWALDQAEAMETALIAQTEFTEAYIPFRDFPGDFDQWDDWPPISASTYSMYHGAYGHALVTPADSEVGVEALCAAVWGALGFVVDHRVGMMRDQIDGFRRGALGLPQVLIEAHILDRTSQEQYNELTLMDFPAAYVIPRNAPLQQSPHEAARLVDFLLFNGVQVEQAAEAFDVEGAGHPAGTYLVWMDQPKRGLANTILWPGWDISEYFLPPLLMRDIAAWSHPLLWGVTQGVMEEAVAVESHPINRADPVHGLVARGQAGAYTYLPASNAAIRATNDLLDAGATLYRMEVPFSDGGRGFGPGAFILPAGPGAKSMASKLANQYGLEVFALAGVPQGAILMEKQKVLLFDTDPGLAYALDLMGFDFDMLSRDEMNDGPDLSRYDVLVNDAWAWGDLSPSGRGSFTSFVNGGGDYIGAALDGVLFARAAELLAFDYGNGDPYGNGVVTLDYNTDDPLAGGYPTPDYGFVYSPVFFTDLSAGTEIAAYFASGDFLVSGYWSDWEYSAPGKPVVVHARQGDSEVTLMGIHPAFRGHPAGTFRLLANAIFNGLD